VVGTVSQVGSTESQRPELPNLDFSSLELPHPGFVSGHGFSRADKRWDQLGFSPWRARSLEALQGCTAVAEAPRVSDLPARLKPCPDTSQNSMNRTPEVSL
jgi:hypothetical protein